MENSGYSLLRNPHTNKDTAFTLEERKQSNIEGLLPEKIETIEINIIGKNVFMKFLYEALIF